MTPITSWSIAASTNTTDKQVDVIAFTSPPALQLVFLVQPAAAGATEPATEAGFYYFFEEQGTCASWYRFS